MACQRSVTIPMQGNRVPGGSPGNRADGNVRGEQPPAGGGAGPTLGGAAPTLGGAASFSFFRTNLPSRSSLFQFSCTTRGFSSTSNLLSSSEHEREQGEPWLPGGCGWPNILTAFPVRDRGSPRGLAVRLECSANAPRAFPPASASVPCLHTTTHPSSAHLARHNFLTTFRTELGNTNQGGNSF